MQLKNDYSRYGAIGQTLHWITVALIIVLLLTGKVGDVDADEPGSALFMWHGSLGILVLLFAAARITWLFVNPPPPLPQGMTRIGRLLAHGVHLMLYALLFALPLSGWLASSAEGAPINFFGITTLPMWQIRIPGQGQVAIPTASAAAGETAQADDAAESNEELFEDVHEVLGNVLLILASIHTLAAIKHQLVDRDGLLSRMLPRTGWHRAGQSDESMRMPRSLTGR